MDFARAEAYLLSTIDESVSRREPYRLERMYALLRELGDPHVQYPTIHVGGTSGKGSTSTMIAAALRASGKRVGLHTKPHLRSMVERARVDGADIPEERFAELLTGMLPALDRVASTSSRPSYYETLLALAFLYFAQERVDVAVIEVGVGGKLDGTNVLVPLVSAITNVGMDHMEILGDTLEAIAADKAGIAKPGVPLVSAVEDPGARAVIESRCTEVGATFVPVRERATIEVLPGPHFGQSFTVTTARARYALALPLLGDFQQINAATAIVALELLPEALAPTPEDVERGFAQLLLPGRMEYFPSFPGIVFDVAHNPDKIAHLIASLRRVFPERRFVFVLAIGESKDAPEILRAFQGVPATFVFTSFEAVGRPSIKPQRLASIAESLGFWGRVIEDPIEALGIARRNARAEEIVVVTGSTFVVAQLRAWWIENVANTEIRR